MISKHEISSAQDAAVYHDKALNQDGISKAHDGKDNYYINEQALATWEGAGAELLGIEGQKVKREDFVAFLEGKMPNPVTGEIQDLADNSRGKERRLGVDFTISPPKSVSLVALIGGDERIMEVHRQANAKAMAWLEATSSVVRVRSNSEVTPHLKGNLIYASVAHETSRSNEPQIHSHNVMVSVVFDKESGKWRSLTNDEVYRNRMTADFIYKAEFARGLKAIGHEVVHSKNNVDWEIKGVSQEHIEAFSSRTKQIREALIARGIDPDEAGYQARQTAALDSRARKVELPREVLTEIWKEHAREIGMDLAPLVAQARERAAELAQQPATQVAARTAAEQDVANKAALRAVSWATEHLSERQQAFREPELVKAALTFQSGITVDDVNQAIGEHAKGKRLVPGHIENVAGKVWTTEAAVRAESVLVGLVVEGKGKGNVVLNQVTDFNLALQAFEQRMGKESGTEWKLSDEQVRAAQNILLHPDTYQGIQGEAGTGKTVALALVRDVAEQQGWIVQGMATAASAAAELQESSGLPSMTVARFQADRVRNIEIAEREVEQLRRAVAEHRLATKDGQRPAYERAQLHAKSLDIDFGKHRYTFDHQKAEVYRSTNSLTSILGAFFTDLAVRGEAAQTARQAAGAPGALGEQVKSGVLAHSVRASDALGRALTSYEKVGEVEANAARNALYLRSEQEHALLRDLDLKQTTLENLKRTGNAQGRKTLLVMDEASLTGALDATKVAEVAKSIGARVVFQGDVQQHGSVPAGRFFWQVQQAGMNTTTLTETMRFVNATDQVKQALVAYKEGRYKDALQSLDRIEVDDGKLTDETAKFYLQRLNDLEGRGIAGPKVGIVTLTNADRKAVNAAVHAALQRAGRLGAEEFVKGHLDDPKLTNAERMHVGVMAEKGIDRLVMRKTYREIGVTQGDVLRVRNYDLKKNRVNVVTPAGKQIALNTQRFDLFDALRAETRVYSVGDQVVARAALHLTDAEKSEIFNGTRGRITSVDKDGVNIAWSNGKDTRLTDKELARVDLAYARTSFAEQGASNHEEIVAIGARAANVLNVEALYVDITRAKLNTTIITSDYETMLRKAGATVEHTMAITNTQLAAISRAVQAEQVKTQRQLPGAGQNTVPSPNQALANQLAHLQYSKGIATHAVVQALHLGKETSPAQSHVVRYVGADLASAPPVAPDKQLQRILEEASRTAGQADLLTPDQLRELEHSMRSEQGNAAKTRARELARVNTPNSLNPADLMSQVDAGKDKDVAKTHDKEPHQVQQQEHSPKHEQHQEQGKGRAPGRDQGWELGF